MRLVQVQGLSSLLCGRNQGQSNQYRLWWRTPGSSRSLELLPTSPGSLTPAANFPLKRGPGPQPLAWLVTQRGGEHFLGAQNSSVHPHRPGIMPALWGKQGPHLQSGAMGVNRPPLWGRSVPQRWVDTGTEPLAAGSSSLHQGHQHIPGSLLALASPWHSPEEVGPRGI